MSVSMSVLEAQFLVGLRTHAQSQKSSNWTTFLSYIAWKQIVCVCVTECRPPHIASPLHSGFRLGKVVLLLLQCLRYGWKMSGS